MCSQRQYLSHCFILSVFSLWMDLTSGMMNIQLIPQYPVIGGSVTLSVTGITGRILFVSWYKGPNTNAKHQIFAYIPVDSSPQINGPIYFSRARPLPPSSLLISDLHLTDSGNYTVSVQTEKPAVIASATLTVYEFSTVNSVNTGAVVGLIVGVILGVALIIIAGFILYRRFAHPVRDRQNETSTDGHIQTPVYENVPGKAENQSSKEDSSYMDLQFRSDETYTELKL
ncbi:uncharacterized protein LOC142107491 isoform X3 [Mixophyes fleayi]|uniref:uncharacterized protein LOC142107491 isoform X3 n=1 Tax=Mixophyes fleayi TaxID=3061075 RepID=UPI003F4E2D52